MSMLAVPWFRGRGPLALMALLLLCGCATGSPPGGLLGSSWRPPSLVPPESPDTRERREVAELLARETLRRREREAAALEAAVETVHPQVWEVAVTEMRVGTRLLVRLRADGKHLVFRECETQRGQGRAGFPVQEGHFRHTLKTALVRQAWGWSGDVVVVLQREEAGWHEEDSRTPKSSLTRSGTFSGDVRAPSFSVPPRRDEPVPTSTRSGAPHSEETKRWQAVQVKLEEYLQWGMRLMEEHAAHLRRIAPGHLLTEHPLREQSINVLVDATLSWAYAHTDDPDFLRRSPSEVALYLLASRSALATAIDLGKHAPPHLDYTPPPEDKYTPEELLLELTVGFVPLLGEGADLSAFLSGYSLTGHSLSESERFISLLGVLLPFANGKSLKEGGEAALGRVALVTGKSLDEVQVLSRVASHLGPENVREIERLLHSASSAGRPFTPEELEFLNRVARRLETPLREAAEVLHRGEKLALLGSRTLPEGSRLVPGTPAHLAQCWVDYQFRHPDKYRRFSYAVDSQWERLYRSILANKPAGNAFENAILTTQGYSKNTAMLVPPPGSQFLGFIPDSVRGHPGELVWGKPYSFVEAKARNELALTGNLKAMLDYVREHGGHVELWIRSAKHPSGETKLTAPLLKYLELLGQDGKVSVRVSPPG